MNKQAVAIIYADGTIEVVAPTSVGALLIGAERIRNSVQGLQVMPPQPDVPPELEQANDD